MTNTNAQPTNQFEIETALGARNYSCTYDSNTDTFKVSSIWNALNLTRSEMSQLADFVRTVEAVRKERGL